MTNPIYGRLRLGGAIYNDARWSVGLNFMPPQNSGTFFGGGAGVQGILETWRDNVRALRSGQIIPDAWKNCIGGAVSLDTIRVSRVGADGKETAVAITTLATPIRGAGQGIHSAQAALVVSLLSARPGASYRGRVYLPAQAAALTGGRVDTSLCDAVATATGTFLRELSTAAANFGDAASCQPVVISTTRNHGEVLTSIRVGNRLDSQRRRAESEQEIYSVAAVAQ